MLRHLAGIQKKEKEKIVLRQLKLWKAGMLCNIPQWKPGKGLNGGRDFRAGEAILSSTVPLSAPLSLAHLWVNQEMDSLSALGGPSWV